MDGAHIKKIIKDRGISLRELANRVGMTNQNLSALLAKTDIKTGLLERVAEAIGMTPAEIYGGVPTASASDHSTAFVGNGNNVGSTDGLLEKAMEDNSRLIEQNTRLLGIIEQLTNKK